MRASIRISVISTPLVLVCVLFLASCVARPFLPPPETVSPSVLLPAVRGGIVDGRGRFREIYKAVLTAQCAKLPPGASCDDGETLWKLSGEAPPTGKPVPSGPSPGGFRVVLVPGLLAECVAEKSLLFGDAAKRLEEIGYKISYIQTRGRQGSAINAELIRNALMAIPPGERLLFVTHSKGSVDALEALVKYPALAERTAALVSVSGAINGSPVADVFTKLTLELAHRAPLPTCLPGEGEEATDSLRRETRLSWLAAHPLPKGVRFYSLAAFTSRENTSRILRPFYDLLARIEPINDSLVVSSDAIVPGSVLLGYPNADHLAVAMPFTRDRTPLLAELIDKNDYPRAALLEAALRYVEEDLDQRCSAP